MSEETLEQKATRIQTEMMAQPDLPPYLREPSFAHEVRAWAMAEAQAEILQAHLDKLEALEPETSTPGLIAMLKGLRKDRATYAANMRRQFGIRKRED